MPRKVRKSLQHKIQEAYCEICFKESKHFEEPIPDYESKKHKISNPKIQNYEISNNLIFCRKCKNSYHGCCTKTNPQDVKVELRKLDKETTDSKKKKESVEIVHYEYVDSCYFCQNEENTQNSKCEICHQEDYLNAKIISNFGEEPEHCHLLCCLLSPRFKISNFENFEFVREPFCDDLNEIHPCEFCGEEVIDGVKCKTDTCGKFSHIRCAIKHKAEFLSKNRNKVLEKGRDIGFHALNLYWTISYGAFEKKNPKNGKIKITEENLKKSDFYIKLIEDPKHNQEFKNQVVRNVLADLNSEEEETRDKESKNGTTLEYKAYCGDHKTNVASSCLCGIVELKVDDSGDNSDINWTFCECCSTWYHNHCVSIERKLSPDEKYICPKCKNKQMLYENFQDFMQKFRKRNLVKNHFNKRKNFIKERQSHILKRDNVHFVDYLIVLESLDNQLQTVKYEDLNYWQEETPFSLEFLKKRKYELEFIQDAIIKFYIKEMKSSFKALLEEASEGCDRIEDVNFDVLTQNFRNLRSDVYIFLADFQNDKPLYKKFNDLIEIMDKLHEIFNKIKEGKICVELIWELYSYLVKGEMIPDNSETQENNSKMEILVKKLMNQVNFFMDIFLKRLNTFRHTIKKLDIFNLKMNDVNQIETFCNIEVEEDSFLEKIKNFYKQQKGEIKISDTLKFIDSCNENKTFKGIDILKNDYKRAVESLFFNDFTGLEEVKLYSKYYRRAEEWNTTYEILLEKMKFMQSEIKNEVFFTESNFENKILLKSEYEILEFNDNIYNKIIDPKYKQRIKSTLENSRKEFNSFEEVFSNVIEKGTPVNPHNLKILKLHGIMLKINNRIENYEENNSIKEKGEYDGWSITEEEVEFFVENTDSEESMAINCTRKYAEEILDLIKEVRDKRFPSNLKKEEKYDKITSTYEKFLNFGLRGKSWGKIQTVMKPIEWLDKLINSFYENKIIKDRYKISRVDFLKKFPKGYLQKANNKILQEFSILNESKGRKIETTGFKQFTELKDIYKKVNIKYHSDMIAEFKKRDKYSVTQMLKIIKLRYLLDINGLEDGLFDSRCERVSKLIHGISSLYGAKNITLYDFCTEVKNLYSEREKLIDIPKSEASYINKAIAWLNQAKMIAKILKSVTEFNSSELSNNNGKYEQYKEIYKVLNSNGFKELGIETDKKFDDKMESFLSKMEELEQLDREFTQILDDVDQVRMSLNYKSHNKNFKYFSGDLIKILERLPKREKIEHLLDKSRDFVHFRAKFETQYNNLEELEKLNKHLEEVLLKYQLFKKTKNIGENINTNNLKPFQLHLKSFISSRLHKIQAIDKDTIEKLKILDLANSGVTLLLKNGMDIQEFQERYEKFNDILDSIEAEENKKFIEDMRIEILLQNKMSKAKVLYEKLYKNPDIEIEDFFLTLENVLKSDIVIIKTDNETLSKYMNIIKQLREAYKKDQVNLAEKITRDDISFINNILFPKKLKKWVTENYSLNSFVKDWAINLSKCDKMNGIEVSCLLEHYKNGSYIGDETFAILDKKYEKTLRKYSDIRIQANDAYIEGEVLKAEEIEEGFKKIKMQLFNEELYILSEIFLNLFKFLFKEDKKEKIPVMKFNEAFEFFCSIETKLKGEQEPLKIYTLGKEIKEEVKEEMMIKAEAGDRNKAFSQLLEYLLPAALKIWNYCDIIKSVIMKSIGEVLQLEKATDEKTTKIFMQNLRNCGKCKKLNLEKLVDFTEIIYQIYEFKLTNESSNISIIELGSSFLENSLVEIEEKKIEKNKTAEYYKKKVEEYIEEETSALKEMIKDKVEERIQNYSIEDILFKEKIIKLALKNGNGRRKSSRVKKIGLSNGGINQFKKSKFDFKKNLEINISDEITKCLGTKIKKLDDMNFLVECLKKEILSKKHSYNDLKKILGILTEKIDEKSKVLDHIIETINNCLDSKQKFPKQNISIISKLKNLDIRKVNKFSSLLSKRKFPNKYPTYEPHFSLDLSEWSIVIVDHNEQIMPINPDSTKFLTKMSSQNLNSIKLPSKKISIDLKNLRSLPDWVKNTLDTVKIDDEQPNVIYGTLEGEIPHFSSNIVCRANTEHQLGEIKMIITTATHIRQQDLKKLGYSKQNILDSVFFIIDLSEIKCSEDKKLEFSEVEGRSYNNRRDTGFFSMGGTPNGKFNGEGKRKKKKTRFAKTVGVSPLIKKGKGF